MIIVANNANAHASAAVAAPVLLRRQCLLVLQRVKLRILLCSALLLFGLGRNARLILRYQLRAEVLGGLVPLQVGRVVLEHDAVQDDAHLQLALRRCTRV